MKNKLSVIIPFYISKNNNNGSDENFSLLAFNKCLKAVFNSSYKNFEVIVVSDGSSTESIKLVKEYPCKLIKIQKFWSWLCSKFRAKKSNGDILIFLDADVEIKTNALKIVNDYFNRKNIMGRFKVFIPIK